MQFEQARGAPAQNTKYHIYVRRRSNPQKAARAVGTYEHKTASPLFGRQLSGRAHLAVGLWFGLQVCENPFSGPCRTPPTANSSVEHICVRMRVYALFHAPLAYSCHKYHTQTSECGAARPGWHKLPPLVEHPFLLCCICICFPGKCQTYLHVTRNTVHTRNKSLEQWVLLTNHTTDFQRNVSPIIEQICNHAAVVRLVVRLIAYTDDSICEAHHTTTSDGDARFEG